MSGPIGTHKVGTVHNMILDMISKYEDGVDILKGVFLMGETHTSIGEMSSYLNNPKSDNLNKHYPNICLDIGIMQTILDGLNKNIGNTTNPDQNYFKIYLEEGDDYVTGKDSLLMRNPLYITYHLLNHPIKKNVEKTVYSTIKHEQRRNGEPFEIVNIGENESYENYYRRSLFHKSNRHTQTGNTHYVNDILKMYFEEDTKIIIAKMGLAHIPEMKVMLEEKKIPVVCISITSPTHLANVQVNVEEYSKDKIKSDFGNLPRSKLLSIYQNDVWNLLLNDDDEKLDEEKIIKIGAHVIQNSINKVPAIKSVKIVHEHDLLDRIGPKLSPKMAKKYGNDFYT